MPASRRSLSRAAPPPDSNAPPPRVPVELEEVFLGGPTRYTRADVAALTGLAADIGPALWRALGFPEVGEDTVAFTDGDVAAMRALRRLLDAGMTGEAQLLGHARALGLNLSRIAAWEVQVALAAAGDDPVGVLESIGPAVLDAAQVVLVSIWRRHMLVAAQRQLALGSAVRPTESPATSGVSPVAGARPGPAPLEQDRADLTVGFADLTGFTTISRRLDDQELAEVLERFEALVTGMVVDAGGAVVKMIGDEVMFSHPDPLAAAALALDLVDSRDSEASVPAIHVGLAYGTVLPRLGDLFGPPVNVAARLADIARGGTCLVDRSLARVVREAGTGSGLRVRRLPRRPVTGYALLEPWMLSRARSEATAATRAHVLPRRHDPG